MTATRIAARNSQVHPLFQDLLSSIDSVRPSPLDHTLAQNRTRARTLTALSDALSPSPPSCEGTTSWAARRSAPAADPLPPSPTAAGVFLSDTVRMPMERMPTGRELRLLYDSFFAPRFRALEEYGAPPEPDPTLAEVVAAGKHTIGWHEGEAHRPGVDPEFARYHRIRAEVIAQTIAPLDALLPQEE